MGYYLVSTAPSPTHERAHYDFGCGPWSMILRLARLGGWEPAGTLAPKDYPNYAPVVEESEGVVVIDADPSQDIPRVDDKRWGYGTNDCQEVTASDAAGIADGLENMLPDIPEHDALANKLVTRQIDGVCVQCIREGTDVSFLEWFSGEGRARLVEFIDFCRQGGFEIR